MNKKFIFDFENLISDPDLLLKIGGKGRNLFHLLNANIPVPKFWCISDDAFLLKDDVNLKEQLKFEIKSSSINEIENDKISYYAVRSSANAEDGIDASFSGQFKTELFVPYSHLIDAIFSCYQSASEQNVIDYLEEKKLSIDNLKMSIVIQKMVFSKKAGVIFTKDPTYLKGNNNLALVAGYGQGEGIVSGAVETDTYYIDRENKNIVHSLIEPKTRMFVFNHIDKYGLIEKTVDDNKINSEVLSEKDIKELINLALKIERHYKLPQDIEWAIDDDTIYIVQSRPITTLLNDHENTFLIDNANIVESFPGVTLPLTQSFVFPVYNKTFLGAFSLVGFSDKELTRLEDTFSELIHFYNGHSFYNLTNWFKILRLVPFSEGYIKAWKTMLGVASHLEDKSSINKNNIFNKFYILARSLFHITKQFISLKANLKKLKDEEEKLITHFFKADNKLPEDRTELEEIFNQFESKYKDWSITLLNDAYAFIFVGISKFIWTKWYHYEEGKFLDLIQVDQNIDSVAPVHSLNNIIQLMTEETKSEMQLFIKNTSYENSPILLSFKDKKITQALNEHLFWFGDRTFGELKLETITFRENPLLFLKLVLEQYNYLDKIKLNKHEDKIQIKYPLLLEFFAIRARHGISERENFRLLRSMKYGMIRRYCRLIGLDFYQKNIITNPNDIFYLTKNEITSYYKQQLDSLKIEELISSRRKDYAAYETRTTFSTYQLIKNANNIIYKPVLDKTSLQTDSTNKLIGIPCSQGEVEAKALVVLDPTTVNLNATELSNYILVTKTTDPGWVFLMKSVKGLIVERGSILSHSAIIGRELGLPTIIGVKDATTRIKQDEIIVMNGDSGEIFVK